MINRKEYQLLRQGDVYIEEVQEIPKTAVKQPATNRLVLAEGEVTGHKHVLDLQDAADYWKDTWNGQPVFYIEVPATEEPKINHEEHGTIDKIRVTKINRIFKRRVFSDEGQRLVND